MKAAVLYHPGGPENFALEDKPIPTPGAEQVLVKVKAFGLNRSELMTRKGLSPSVRFPRVLGIECVGEVVLDPTGKFKPGQKVAAFMGGMGRDFDGSYAEFAVLPQSILYPFESHLSWKLLGAIPEMFQTVYGSLHLALKTEPGESILIRGGTSSIGMLATQLAKKSGLTVLATTRKPEKIELLKGNGADHVLIDDGNLEGKVKAIYPEGVHKVLELIGTSTLNDSLRCTAPGGTVCMTGMLSEQWSVADFTPMEYIPATVHLTIYDSGQIRVDGQSFQQFIRDVEAGTIKLSINKTFPIIEIAAAHQFMESNSAGGKIVILTGD
ncbi:zinc-binding alcohol dehydrogenase family protein [Pontibacter harenae]|uniref:zinc-binding alcohol dehydrogenase family protein n=1 Tax=Pontibacter harenae TaxID=2894083 RepID=UPI001E5B86E5|nr:zinc-binding alcohol dehydrogenase family protein [Pontibacter harenae]MCC9168976.1 zinc-binding alcohol dehydrogenase family protein [Pontibacter harenae]